MNLWRLLRGVLLPPQTHDITCKWCKNVNALIKIRKAEGRGFGTDIGLANSGDKCDRARALIDAEDKRLRIGY